MSGVQQIEVVTLASVVREIGRAGGRVLFVEQVKRALKAGRLELPGLVRVGAVLALPPECVAETKRRLAELDTAPTKRQREKAASGAA